jgi:hypothetical protein
MSKSINMAPPTTSNNVAFQLGAVTQQLVMGDMQIGWKDWRDVANENDGA